MLGRAVIASVVGLSLSGCATAFKPPEDGMPIETMQGPLPTRAETPMGAPLACLANSLPPSNNLRIGVSDITDGTGALVDNDTVSRALTQRPDLMMVTALAKTGVRLVNRSSTAVAEWELKQALERRLGDGRQYTVGGRVVNFRPVPVGGLLGSTHYVTGALTELNWDIESAVAEAGAFGIEAGSRGYFISIGFDVMATNTVTTEISMARAYNKQIYGREMKAGIFRFFDIGTAGKNIGPVELFEANIGEQKNEPVQTAVRWVVETAAFDLVRELAGLDGACEDTLPGAALIQQASAVGAQRAPVVPSVDEEVEPSIERAPPPEVGPLEPPRQQAVPLIIGQESWNDEAAAAAEVDDTPGEASSVMDETRAEPEARVNESQDGDDSTVGGSPEARNAAPASMTSIWGVSSVEKGG